MESKSIALVDLWWAENVTLYEGLLSLNQVELFNLKSETPYAYSFVYNYENEFSHGNHIKHPNR